MARKYRFGILGWPLEQSLSPLIHQAALAACGLSGEYNLYPVQADPLDTALIGNLLAEVRSGTLDGLNVTIPFKQTVIDYLDELSPTAEAIGAVNTIYQRNGLLLGDNTDAPGFIQDLRNLGWFDELSTRSSFLVLGAGGAARAIVHALLQPGCKLVVASRRQGQAEALIRSMIPHFQPAVSGALQATALQKGFLSEMPKPDLVVNTTPAGMLPDVNQSPWPIGEPFPANARVYDLIYKPSTTLFMEQASRSGLAAANGLGMLVEQALLSFECWTGTRPDKKAIFSALTRVERKEVDI
jgi:shikimate dehydrogenase